MKRLIKKMFDRAHIPGDISIYLESPYQITFGDCNYEGASPYDPSVRVFLNQPERITLGVYNTTPLGHGRNAVKRNLYACASLSYNEAKQLHALLGAMLRKVGEE